MKTHDYQPKNVCAQKITFDLEGDTIYNVKFHGGCSGFSKGVSNLLEGASAKEAVSRMESINCQNRGTSCPAELAKALKEALETQ
jgi:uncharacterized protein (TIGR03905 family)